MCSPLQVGNASQLDMSPSFHSHMRSLRSDSRTRDKNTPVLMSDDASGPAQRPQRSYRLFGVVTRFVVVSNLYSRSRRAAFWPAISVLHLHFSQQSQYAVGEVLFSLAKSRHRFRFVCTI